MSSAELLVERREGRVLLAAPEVGTFTCALAPGRVCTPGMDAGVIRTLGRKTSLLVPEGVTGRVVSDRPELIHQPVSWGDVLYELAPIEAEDAQVVAEAPGAAGSGANVFASPHSGRFWHRSAPGEPAFAEPGTILEAGQPVGLIEVMKTFGRVTYDPGSSLPARARVVRMLAEDGAEVGPGDPLLELEEA